MPRWTRETSGWWDTLAVRDSLIHHPLPGRGRVPTRSFAGVSLTPGMCVIGESRPVDLWEGEKSRERKEDFVFCRVFSFLDAFLDDISYCLYIWNTIL